MNNNKATESQKKLLILLLMAVVFFAAYRFAYQPLAEETATLEDENDALEREIADLKNKAQNEAIYQAETEAIHASIGEVLAKFGPGVTPEKSILFFIELARVAEVQIPTISFGTPVLVYTTSSLTNEEGAAYGQYMATYNVAYSTSYQGLKTLIAYINQYPEKMNISTLTAAYNSETDSLSGNLSIDWYMLTGTKKQYQFDDLGTIDIGNQNIFRSGSGEGAGEGFEFEFDFGNLTGNQGDKKEDGNEDGEDAGNVDGVGGADGNDGGEDAGNADGAEGNDGGEDAGNADSADGNDGGEDAGNADSADGNDGGEDAGNVDEPEGSDGDSDGEDAGNADEPEGPDGNGNGGDAGNADEPEGTDGNDDGNGDVHAETPEGTDGSGEDAGNDG